MAQGKKQRSVTYNSANFSYKLNAVDDAIISSLALETDIATGANIQRSLIKKVDWIVPPTQHSHSMKDRVRLSLEKLMSWGIIKTDGEIAYINPLVAYAYYATDWRENGVDDEHWLVKTFLESRPFDNSLYPYGYWENIINKGPFAQEIEDMQVQISASAETERTRTNFSERLKNVLLNSPYKFEIGVK